MQKGAVSTCQTTRRFAVTTNKDDLAADLALDLKYEADSARDDALTLKATLMRLHQKQAIKNKRNRPLSTISVTDRRLGLLNKQDLESMDHHPHCHRAGKEKEEGGERADLATETA